MIKNWDNKNNIYIYILSRWYIEFDDYTNLTEIKECIISSVSTLVLITLQMYAMFEPVIFFFT